MRQKMKLYFTCSSLVIVVLTQFGPAVAQLTEVFSFHTTVPEF